MRSSFILLLIVFIAVAMVGCTSGIQEAYQPHQFDNFGIDQSVQLKPKISVAVLPFRNSSGSGGAGIKLSESFIVQLLKIGRYEVVERTRLQNILSEQKLSQSSIIDQETAVRIGKLAQVDAIIVGTVSDYRDIWEGEAPPEVGANIRLIDVEKGNIMWAASEHFRGDDASVQLLVKRQDRWKVATDIDFLTMLLCRSMASSMAL